MEDQTTPDIARSQSPYLSKQISHLLADVINLATYALEVGRLPETISFSDLYHLWEKETKLKEKLVTEEIDYIQFCYQQLETELSPISAISLRATDVSGARKRKDYMNTEAGKYAKRMWIMAFTILAFILGINLYQYTFDMYASDWAVNNTNVFGSLTILYWLAASLTPFAYGAFGATVRMLRITETRLRERSFDPRRLVEHRNRMVLGTLSGGVVVLVYSTGGVGEGDIKLTEAALGFLAGYSIDLLFSLLDRLVNAISPGDIEKPKTHQSEKKSHSRSMEVNTAVNEVVKSDANISKNSLKQTVAPHLMSVEDK